MILNNADNIMYGSNEVQKVYCGDELVWERESPVPVRPVPPEYENMEYFTFPEAPNHRPINTLYRPTTIPAKMETRIKMSKYFPTGSTMAYLIGGYNSAPTSYQDKYTFYVVFSEASGTIGLVPEIVGQLSNSTSTTVLQAPLTAPALGSWVNISTEWDLQNVKITAGDRSNQNYSYTKFKSFIARDVWIGSNGEPTSATANTCFTGDMAYFKLYKGDGTLARDMVPAKRKSDSREGFWDFVTETFYTY